ncbi:MAG: magnesium transporter CorA family protein [Anaerolineales bacterium]|nr:magnesium transporter CorA family protein [Anaerolineales bacterium]
MLLIFRNDEQGLKTLSEPVNGCWLHAVDPTPAEIAQLGGLGFPADNVAYALDPDERPRAEREGDDWLVLMRIPYFRGEVEDVPYATVPLGVLFNANHILTVCRMNTDVLQEFTAGRVRDLSTAKHNRFVLRLLLNASVRYLAYLREISRVVEALEDRLQLSIRNQEVMELLRYQKSLTYFTTALKANELMMERLQKGQLFEKYPDDAELLDDALTETMQAIEMTSIESNILSGMMDAFASIISNNLNQVMKLLTSITIVLSFPALVAALYGMNVALPLGAHPSAFPIILGISLLLSLTVVLILKKLDWF